MSNRWIIGGTGTGKSTLMKRLALEEIERGEGVLFIDPHGDAIDDILGRIPKARTADVLVIDPSDAEFPVGWNLLENVPPSERPFVVSALSDTIKWIWKYDRMPTPVMDRMTYNTIAALLEYPGATLLHIEPMLTSPTFRRRVLEHVSDPVLLHKWAYWNTRSPKDWNALISSTENKAGEFSEDPRIRHVIGQARSTFHLKRMMFGRKIVMLRLPQGRLGLKKTSMFGSLFLSHLQAVAYSRTVPLPFHVFIDECHNFDTPVLREMLSGVRKFGVTLTLANQYMAQLSPELESAILANTETKYIFRVGYEDSEQLHRSIPKHFQDIDFAKLPPFWARVITAYDDNRERLPDLSGHSSRARRNRVVMQSKRAYGTPRGEVEEAVARFLKGID